MRPNRRPRRKMALLLAAFLFFAGILGALILRKYEMSRMKPSPPPQVQEAGTLLVTLFFSSPQGGLVREAREIDACSDPATCAEEVLDELINGPLGEKAPTLPPTAAVRSVAMQGDTAVVDLAKETVDGLAGGSDAEVMAVYSMIDSLAVNFSTIKKVKFLVEGENVSSLGHLDLSTPLPPDFTLEKQK